MSDIETTFIGTQFTTINDLVRFLNVMKDLTGIQTVATFYNQYGEPRAVPIIDQANGSDEMWANFEAQASLARTQSLALQQDASEDRIEAAQQAARLTQKTEQAGQLYNTALTAMKRNEQTELTTIRARNTKSPVPDEVREKMLADPLKMQQILDEWWQLSGNLDQQTTPPAAVTPRQTQTPERPTTQPSPRRHQAPTM